MGTDRNDFQELKGGFSLTLSLVSSEACFPTVSNQIFQMSKFSWVSNDCDACIVDMKFGIACVEYFAPLI